MITAAIPPALTAGAVLTWPRATATPRLKSLHPNPTRTRRPWPRPTLATLIATATLMALVVLGIGPAIAVAIAGITARAQWRARARTLQRIAAAEAMSEAIHGMAAELRAGAHPVAAAESAAQDAKPPADAVLTAMVTTARLDGDMATVQRRFTHDIPVPALRPLTNAWTLAHTQGLPLADIMDAVRTDVAGQVRFAKKVKARMAGPQASGTVLAGLPIVGVLLGEAMGADPLHVLLTNPLGQALLVTGTALICLGLHWINKLTTQAVLP